MIEIIIYVVIGVFTLLGAEAVYFFVRYRGERQREQLKRRLSSLSEASSASLLKERRIARSTGIEKMLKRLPFVESIERLILQTDISWTVASLLSYSFLLASFLCFVSLFLLPHLPLFSVVAALLGFSFPLLYVANLKSKRNQKISTQLPEALDMMSRSLKAGHGIAAAFKLVATEMPPPIAVEFGRCFEENTVGVEFRDAVTKMTLRVPDNMDLKLFAVSLIIQFETGGNLIEILEKISSTIRERYKFYGKLRALTAEVKASGFVLALLPLLFAGVITVINPNYLMPLLHEPMGLIIVGVAFVLWILGILGIRTLAKIDY